MDATFFPSGDAELVAWSWAIARKLNADAASLGVNASVAGMFIATQARFTAAVASVGRSPRSAAARGEAGDARASLLSVASTFAGGGRRRIAA